MKQIQSLAYIYTFMLCLLVQPEWPHKKYIKISNLYLTDFKSDESCADQKINHEI